MGFRRGRRHDASASASRRPGPGIAAIARPARWKRASRDSRRARSLIRTRPSFRASSRRHRTSLLLRSASALLASAACGWRPRRSGCFLTGAASHSKKDGQKKTAHASEQQRPDVLRRRIAWFDGQLDLDPERLIFIDETAASTKMARLRGRAPCGERCRAPIPHGHWKTTTFTAGLRLSGMAAPMLCSMGQ